MSCIRGRAAVEGTRLTRQTTRRRYNSNSPSRRRAPVVFIGGTRRPTWPIPRLIRAVSSFRRPQRPAVNDRPTALCLDDLRLAAWWRRRSNAGLPALRAEPAASPSRGPSFIKFGEERWLYMIFCLYSSSKCQLLWWTWSLFSLCLYLCLRCCVVFLCTTVFRWIKIYIKINEGSRLEQFHNKMKYYKI